MAYFAVDRIEGRLVVLIGDDGSEHEIPRKTLPKGLTEGSILAVDVLDGHNPEWAAATLDAAERERRTTKMMKQLEELKKGDPGGDVVL